MGAAQQRESWREVNKGQGLLSTLGRTRKRENYPDHYFESNMFPSLVKTVGLGEKDQVEKHVKCFQIFVSNSNILVLFRMDEDLVSRGQRTSR